jgi:hypothetical protein
MTTHSRTTPGEITITRKTVDDEDSTLFFTAWLTHHPEFRFRIFKAGTCWMELDGDEQYFGCETLCSRNMP